MGKNRDRDAGGQAAGATGTQTPRRRDRRVEKTRDAIQGAFQELLLERSYASITVQDILDRANVGRSTFYSHFEGKDDLLRRLVDSICDHALNPAAPEHHHDFVGRSGPEAVVEHMLCHLHERESGVCALLVGDTAGMFTDCLRGELAQRANAALDVRPGTLAAGMDRAFLVNHVAGSFVELVIWWARDGFRAGARELARDYLAAILPLLQPRHESPRSARARTGCAHVPAQLM